MAAYLEKGVLNLEKTIEFLYLRMASNIMLKIPNFLELFKNWSDSLKKRIVEFSKEMNLKDSEKYGHERSLIAISI